jgi:MFS transporter, DHA1 family, inner membrane transport protein
MIEAPRDAVRAAPGLRVQLVAATLARVVINTAHRMVYPFLPALSRGLGLPLENLTALLSLRGALGVVSPVFGGLPDRFGRRQALLVGLVIFSVGLALPGFFPGPATFVVFIVLVAIGKFIYDPALQAYLGDRTPYARRGLVMAFSEMSWSGAALLGIPLAGLLIARFDWHAPFLPLAAAGLAAGAALWFIIPSDAPTPGQPRAASPGNLAAVWRNPVVLAGLSLSLLISLGNENLSVVYAAWLERSFGLSVAALGLSTTVIGAAELAGEGLVMAFADRLGKRRVIAIGLVVSTAAYLALPLAGGRLDFALAGLFFVFIAFEFTVVATLPLMTELVPAARGRVMTTNVAALAAGRMLGDLLAGYLFHFGFLWIGLASVATSLVALVILIAFVHETA